MLTAVLLTVAVVLVWPAPGSPGRSVEPGASDGVGPPGGSAGRVRTAAARPGGRSAPDDSWVADVAEVVAVGLEAGLDLPRAVTAAARSPSVRRSAPWLADRLREVRVAGGAVSACLDPPGRTSAATRADLGLLAASWRLAEESGAPASSVTAAAAEAVRERRASRHRAAVAVAGPRTSMWLLTALPLLGPVGAALAGLGPARLYATTGARVAAVAGVLLTTLGWLWARRLLARAARPATTGTAVADPAPARGRRP